MQPRSNRTWFLRLSLSIRKLNENCNMIIMSCVAASRKRALRGYIVGYQLSASYSPTRIPFTGMYPLHISSFCNRIRRPSQIASVELSKSTQTGLRCRLRCHAIAVELIEGGGFHGPQRLNPVTIEAQINILPS